MSNSLTIRKPDIRDLNAIVHLNRVSLPENYPVGYFIELIRQWHEVSVVAELDGEIVGYVILRLERERSFPFRFDKSDKGHVISVAVLPKLRRLGIGKKMMLEVMSAVRKDPNIKSITLEVRMSNDAAVKLYENLDYIKSEILKNYYADGEGAYLMKLKL